MGCLRLRRLIALPILTSRNTPLPSPAQTQNWIISPKRKAGLPGSRCGTGSADAPPSLPRLDSSPPHCRVLRLTVCWRVPPRWTPPPATAKRCRTPPPFWHLCGTTPPTARVQRTWWSSPTRIALCFFQNTSNNSSWNRLAKPWTSMASPCNKASPSMETKARPISTLMSSSSGRASITSL